MTSKSKPKSWVAWSSGKDASWALHMARQRGQIDVVGLLVTITDPFDRVSMHGVRSSLVQSQADALGLPIECVRIPNPCSDEVYADQMRQALGRAQEQGVDSVVFGDLFLEDVRRYREEQMAKVCMQARFPIWGRATGQLSREMIAGGLKAVVTCVDLRHMPLSLVGRNFDEAFLSELPRAVDACGERGEFHSFVFDGPMFSHAIPIRVGEVVERDGFGFADLLPK